MRRRYVVLSLIALAAVLLAAASGPLMSKVEEPTYVVKEAAGPVEVRDYPSATIATVTIEGDRKSAIQNGFQTLAGYIFGANEGGKRIEMTAPVMQQPAAGDGSHAAGWTVRFIMPRAWSLQSLPAAKDDRIRFKSMSAGTFAVIRFAGFWRDALLRMKTDELRAFMSRRGLKESGSPIYAFYNPPWTLPFLRRNEIMIRTNPAQGGGAGE